MRRRYYHDELGYNFRMTDVHAAIGLEQLKKLSIFNKKRIENAAYFTENLTGVVVPTVPDGYEHVFHQYTIRVPGGKRDAMIEYLREHDVGSGVYYPVPIHKQTYYVNDLGYNQTLPEAELAAKEVLSLPVHPGLSQEDLDKIISTVNKFSDEYL
jgi:perosamine synthetase